MRTILSSLTACLLAAASAASAVAGGAKPTAAANAVTVEFVQPERYADVQVSGYSTEASREMLLPDLKKWIQTTGADLLKPGTALTLRITDIDDAGQMNRGARRDIRVVSNLFPAQISFSWQLTNGKNVVKSGSERLVQIAGESGERPDFLGSMPTVKYALWRWMRGALR